MGDLDRKTGLPADQYGLLDRIPQVTIFAPHVADVAATDARRLARQRDDLLRLRVNARVVLEARGEAERAGLQLPAEQNPHQAGFRHGGCPAVVVSEHFGAEPTVAHVRRHVDRYRGALQPPEEIGERESRPPVLAHHDGRDALADRRSRLGTLEDPPIVMAVRIDEARRQHEARGIHDVLTRDGCQVAYRAHRVDDSGLDAHIRRHRGRPRSVEDRGASEERDVLGRGGRSVRCEHLARQRPRMLTALDHELPVDQHVLDPLGILVGLESRGLVPDGLEIEHHDVRPLALPNQPPIAKPQDLGRKRGHRADGSLDAHDAALEGIPPDLTGEVSVEAGVRQAVAGHRDARVRSRGHPGLGVEVLEIDLGEREAAQAGAARLIGVALQLELQRHLHGRHVRFVSQLAQCLADEVCVRMSEHENVVGVAPPEHLVAHVAPDHGRRVRAVEQAAKRDRIVHLPTTASLEIGQPPHPGRNQHGAPIAPGGVVRVGVSPDVHAAIPRPLDQPDHRLTRAPEVGASGLDVRLHGRHTGAFGDLDGLHHGVQHGRRPFCVLAGPPPHGLGAGAALVHHVHAVVRRHLAHQRHHLVRRRPDLGRVLVPRAHAVRALLHGLAHEVLHRGHLVRGGHAPEVVAHDHAPHLAVAHQSRGVGSGTTIAVRPQLIANGPGRSSVLVDHQRGHALRDHVGRRAVPHVLVR